MKKLYLLLCCLPVLAKAQPAGYYDNAFGKTGEALRVALYGIIKGHTVLSYTPGLWNAYYTTDVKPGTNKLWDIYSDKPGGTPAYEYTLGADQCGNGANHENSCYNREHIWPQSKFGSAAPMETDLWIVYPTDYYVNNKRGDLPYGKVGSPVQLTFTNGSKLGPQSYPGAPSSSCFEPIDSFKGDIARSYFYITTRYYADSAQFQDWEMAYHSRLKPWAIQMLLAWHHLDPVSAKEKDRNEAAYTLQHNRNPFIDIPQFADCIWAGNCTGLSVMGSFPLLVKVQVYPNPAHESLSIDWQQLAPDEVLAVDILNLQGQLMWHTRTGGSAAHLQVPVADWPRGIYLLKAAGKEGVKVERVVVE